mgnify:FL=1
MNLDFETLLVAFTLITGIIWGWDKLRSRRGEAPVGDDVPWWLDLSRSLFPVILAVLVIRSFVVEPFRIPSGSMVPTLLTGDFIVVNKFSYGIRLPVTHTKIIDVSEPERGDVVVFRYPLDENQDYIKRVIGLPGDLIEYRAKRLYVNGEAIEQQPVGPYRDAGAEPDSMEHLETLDGAEHRMLVNTESPSRDFRYRVPENTYFMMGDNRDRSSDSRFWGPVPESHLVGKAFMIWMSWDSENFGINFGRIGDVIR